MAVTAGKDDWRTDGYVLRKAAVAYSVQLTPHGWRLAGAAVAPSASAYGQRPEEGEKTSKSLFSASVGAREKWAGKGR